MASSAIPLEKRELILKLRQSGMKQTAIAAAAGCSQKAVSDILRRWKETGSLAPLKPPIPAHKRKVVVEMIEAGFSIREVAPAVGISEGAIYNIRKDAQRREGFSDHEAAMREILARSPDMRPGDMHAQLSRRKIFVSRREIVRTMQALADVQS